MSARLQGQHPVPRRGASASGPQGRAMGRIVALALALCVAQGAATAKADGGNEPCVVSESCTPTTIEWSPDWTRFRLGEWFVAGGAVATLITAGILGPREDHWNDRLRFDETVRDALRLHSFRGQQIAQDTSDVLLSLAVTYPILVDAVLVSAWYHDSPDVGFQIGLLMAEVLSVTAGLTAIAKVAGARERPFVRNCGGSLDADTLDCTRTSRFQSFFSGHSSTTFAAAGATCMIHRYIPLYGGGRSEVAPCLVGMSLALTTALLRVVGDVHYATDVLAGGVLGAGVGLLLPWLHFRHATPLRRQRAEVRLVPYGLGIGLVGEVP